MSELTARSWSSIFILNKERGTYGGGGILLIIFATDQIYSNKHPNMGEGITSVSGMSTNEMESEAETE